MAFGWDLVGGSASDTPEVVIRSRARSGRYVLAGMRAFAMLRTWPISIATSRTRQRCPVRDTFTAPLFNPLSNSPTGDVRRNALALENLNGINGRAVIESSPRGSVREVVALFLACLNAPRLVPRDDVARPADVRGQRAEALNRPTRLVGVAGASALAVLHPKAQTVQVACAQPRRVVVRLRGLMRLGQSLTLESAAVVAIQLARRGDRRHAEELELSERPQPRPCDRAPRLLGAAAPALVVDVDAFAVDALRHVLGDVADRAALRRVDRFDSEAMLCRAPFIRAVGHCVGPQRVDHALRVLGRREHEHVPVRASVVMRLD